MEGKRFSSSRVAPLPPGSPFGRREPIDLSFFTSRLIIIVPALLLASAFLRFDRSVSICVSTRRVSRRVV